MGPPAQPQWAPGSALPPTATGDRPLSTVTRFLMLGGVAAAILGCFLPWARIFIVEVAGTETDDGKLFLGIAAVAALFAVLALTKPRSRPFVITFVVLSALLVLGSLYEIGDLTNSFEEEFGDEASDVASIGGGLLLLLVGAIAALAGGIKGLLDTRTVTPAYAPPQYMPPTAPGGWSS
jgi:hypothetical protein